LNFSRRDRSHCTVVVPTGCIEFNLSAGRRIYTFEARLASAGL
jgi:hypothetical protein